MSAPIDILVNIGDLWVNTLDIVEIESDHYHRRLYVRMRGGAEHTVRPITIYELTDLEKRIVEHVNHAHRVYAERVERVEPKFKPA